MFLHLEIRLVVLVFKLALITINNTISSKLQLARTTFAAPPDHGDTVIYVIITLCPGPPARGELAAAPAAATGTDATDDKVILRPSRP